MSCFFPSSPARPRQPRQRRLGSQAAPAESCKRCCRERCTKGSRWWMPTGVLVVRVATDPWRRNRNLKKNNENRENWQMQHGIEHDFAAFPLIFMTFYSKMESLRSLIWSIEQWKMIFFSLAEFGVVDPASLCFSGFAMGLAEGSCTDPDGWHKFALLQIYLPKTRAAKHQSARIAARPVDPANLVLHRRRDWLDSQFTPWSRIGFPVESMSSMWCGTHL